MALLVGVGILGARLAWHAQARARIRSWWLGPRAVLTRPSPGRLELGINLPWLNYGHDFGAVPGWTWDGASRNQAKLRRRFQVLKQSGVDHVTWFLLGDGEATPSLDDHGYPKEPDERFWADYDAAVRIARETDVGIVWVLLDYLAFTPSGPNATPRKGGLADLIVDRDKRRVFFDKVLKKLFERTSWERNIVGWELVNEPEHAVKEGYVDQHSMDDFLVEAARLVRATTQQPATVGHADLESMVAFAARCPEVSDFLVFHEYGQVPPPSVDHLREVLRRERVLEKWKTIPIYVGEFDGDAPPLGAEWPTWALGLGYAGIWPWSMVTAKNGRRCPDDLCTDPVAWAAHSRRLTADSDLAAWSSHASHATEQLAQELAKLAAEIEKDRLQIKESQETWLPQAERILAEQNGFKQKVEADIALAQGHVTECTRRLEELRQRKAGDENQLRHHIAKAATHLRLSEVALQKHQEDWARVKQEIEKQQAEMVKHTRLIMLHTSQLAWKEPRLRLRRDLYFDFWQAEGQMVPAGGPVGQQQPRPTIP